MSARYGLLARLREQALVRGASGARADTYVDVRRVALTPRGADAIAGQLCLFLRPPVDLTAIGSLGVGGALLLPPLLERTGLPGFLVRAPKGHGLDRWIEGPRLAGFVALIDDVAASLVHAAHVVRAAGAAVVFALVLVDREEGAAAALSAMGVPLCRVFMLKELADAR